MRSTINRWRHQGWRSMKRTMPMVQIPNVQETVESRFPVALAHRSRVSMKLLVSSGPVLLLCTVLRFVARHIVFLCGHNVAQGGKRHIAWGGVICYKVGHALLRGAPDVRADPHGRSCVMHRGIADKQINTSNICGFKRSDQRSPSNIAFTKETIHKSQT